ncbi:MAG: MBOAT family O-acyltransferase [Anaerolineales bacterium]
MTLTFILILAGLAAVLGLFARGRWRLPLLLSVSALTVYALQPALPIRYLDFWLPTATLGLVVLGWVLTAPPDRRAWRDNWGAAAILGAVVLLLALSRLLGLDLPAVGRPPRLLPLLLFVTGVAGLAVFFQRSPRLSRLGLALGVFFLLLLFICLKYPPLTTALSAWLRRWNAQSAALASALDLRWLGFSYLAFRLLHTFRDRQAGRLPPVSLAEYAIYAVFFPALAAGPIDRIERFVEDLRRPRPLDSQGWLEAGRRLTLGLFKKFVLADTLALIALSPVNALQVHSAGWAWVLLYAYSLQLYFDFAGYTDIAIGLGRLVGVKLPENFNAPYLKPNLTQFWNNWHMTLTQWIRAYVFNPLTRALRASKRSLPAALIILAGQLSTMLLIGLWHGITWNFVLWGLWHAAGLFFHNRWSEWTRPRLAAVSGSKRALLDLGGALLTFHYVTLGWVWFALPDPLTSWQVFLKLMGVS